MHPDAQMAFTDNARWIWSSSASNDGWWMFRKTLLVPEDCQSAVLNITAGFHYIAYVNGQFCARGPGRSYDFCKSYDQIDVYPFLSPGAAAVVAVLAPTGQPQGLLAELIFTGHAGNRTVIASDAGWKTCLHPAFSRDTPGYAIPLGREEKFDARLEQIGWECLGYNDASWEAAVELGPVGMAPWTRLEASAVGLLSEDPFLPRNFSAIELAQRRIGYRFRLFSPSECMKIFATEFTHASAGIIRLFFRSGEPKVALDGRLVEPRTSLDLTPGVHLLSICQLGYGAVELEGLIETRSELSFSAGAILEDQAADWAVYAFPARVVSYPWHESAASLVEATPDVSRILAVSAVEHLPAEFRAGFSPAENRQPSAYLDVITQQVFQVAGGHTDPAIQRGQPRSILPVPLQSPFCKPGNLLHSHADAAFILPIHEYDTHFVLDFGREIIGHVQFQLNAPAGAILDLQCFELIDGRGIAWMENLNGFRYICREGLQTYTSHYRRGFRYISVSVRDFDRPIQFYSLRCLQTTYPVQEIGSFECSDWQLNKIYRMSVETARVCMLDTYVDCPGHEQNFWVGDARITALINLLTFGAYDLNQHSIRLVGQSLSAEWARTYRLKDEMSSTGHYLPIAAFPNYPEGGLPMWSFLWILQCWEHYLYGGSEIDLQENFGYVAETLRRCRLLTNERGLLDISGAWNLIEWGNNDLSAYGEVTANNVLLVLCLERAALMAQALGLEQSARDYIAEAAQRRETINRFCWDDGRQAYVDTVRDAWAYQHYMELCQTKGWEAIPWNQFQAATRISEQSNTLSLLCECVPPDRTESVWRISRAPPQGTTILARPPTVPTARRPSKKRRVEIVAVGSPFFLFFTLEAFFKQKDAAGALEIVRRDWGKMAAHGTQTCWETFEFNETVWTRSVAHAWSATPAIYLPQSVLGIRPLAPGFRQFAVEPFTDGLEWARGAVPTPFGPIFVEWQRDEQDAVKINCSAPEACEWIHRDPTVMDCD